MRIIVGITGLCAAAVLAPSATAAPAGRHCGSLANGLPAYANARISCALARRVGNAYLRLPDAEVDGIVAKPDATVRVLDPATGRRVSMRCRFVVPDDFEGIHGECAGSDRAKVWLPS